MPDLLYENNLVQDSRDRTRQTTSYQDHEIMTARSQQVHWSIQLCQSKALSHFPLQHQCHQS